MCVETDITIEASGGHQQPPARCSRWRCESSAGGGCSQTTIAPGGTTCIGSLHLPSMVEHRRKHGRSRLSQGTRGLLKPATDSRRRCSRNMTIPAAIILCALLFSLGYFSCCWRREPRSDALRGVDNIQSCPFGFASADTRRLQ